MMTQVPGNNTRNKVTLYALSTCGWCRKTKRLLEENSIAYEYIDVDLITAEEEAEVMSAVRRWNPALTFPTIIINGKVIVGFQEDKIKEALGL